MTQVIDTKNDQLQVRLDANAKAMLRRAAGYRRRTVSQFVLATAQKEAAKVIRNQESLTVSDRDWTAFYDALMTPPVPNEALRAAFGRYRQRLVR